MVFLLEGDVLCSSFSCSTTVFDSLRRGCLGGGGGGVAEAGVDRALRGGGGRGRDQLSETSDGVEVAVPPSAPMAEWRLGMTSGMAVDDSVAALLLS